MIVSAASQAQSATDFIMGIEHKESLQECQTSPEGMPLTWARDMGLTPGSPALPTATRTATGLRPSWNGSTAPGRPTGSPGHTGNPCRYEKPEHSPAHLCAPAPSSRSFASFAQAGGRRVLAAPAFGTAANQRTFKDDPRPGRPIERAVRPASVPSQFGGFTVRRPAFSPAPWQNFARDALNCGHCSGRRALRVLGPSAIADAAIQRNLPESSGFVRPFFPSSPSPKPLLRAKRKGGGICFDLSSGVLGNQFRDSLNDPARQTGLSYFRVRFPGSNDRQECTFPRKSAEAGRWRSLSRHSCACQARFGGSHLFSNPPTKQPQ